MKSSLPLLFALTAAAALGAAITVAGQAFKLDSIHYDSFGGLVTLGWESQAGGVYSVHTSTNLISWDEVRALGGVRLRVPAATGTRTQIELELPAGDRRFWRVGKLPITDLGTLASASDISSYPTLRDVNDGSRIVGAIPVGSSTIGFTWAPGEEMISFGQASYAAAVNEGGQVVGTRDGRFFSWTRNGGLKDLGAGSAVDVNEAGHILGSDGSGAFLWKPGVGKVRIPHLSATEPYTVPEALSDDGHVVGVSLINGSYYRAFLWTEAGGLVDLTLPLSAAASGAADVNSNGQVVGFRVVAGGSTRAFSWTAAGGVVTFPPGCYITDLNEGGKVVGRNYQVGNQAHAFSWTQSGGIVDLGLGQPEHVNELGQIVGYASAGTALLWSPTGVLTEFEGLSSGQTEAYLINNVGVVFGVSRPADGGARHVVMWTTLPPP